MVYQLSPTSSLATHQSLGRFFTYYESRELHSNPKLEQKSLLTRVDRCTHMKVPHIWWSFSGITPYFLPCHDLLYFFVSYLIFLWPTMAPLGGLSHLIIQHLIPPFFGGLSQDPNFCLFNKENYIWAVKRDQQL